MTTKTRTSQRADSQQYTTYAADGSADESAEREYSVDDVRNIASLLTPRRKPILSEEAKSVSAQDKESPAKEDADTISYDYGSQPSKGLSQKELEAILAETTGSTQEDILEVISAYQSGSLTQEQRKILLRAELGSKSIAERIGSILGCAGSAVYNSAGYLGRTAVLGVAGIRSRITKPVASYISENWKGCLSTGLIAAGVYCFWAGTGMYGFMGGEAQVAPGLVAIGGITAGLTGIVYSVSRCVEVHGSNYCDGSHVASGVLAGVFLVWSLIGADISSKSQSYQLQQWDKGIKSIETSVGVSKSEKEARIRLEIAKHLASITQNESGNSAGTATASTGMDYARAVQKAGYTPKESWKILSKLNSFFSERQKTSELELAATAYIKAMAECKASAALAEQYLECADLTFANIESNTQSGSDKTTKKDKTPKSVVDIAIQIMKHDRGLSKEGYENLYGASLYEKLMLLTKDSTTEKLRGYEEWRMLHYGAIEDKVYRGAPAAAETEAQPPVSSDYPATYPTMICSWAKQYATALKKSGIEIKTGTEYLEQAALRLAKEDRIPEKVVQTAIEMLK